MSYRVSCRPRLCGLPPGDAHAGLWLDRFLPAQELKEGNGDADSDAVVRQHGYHPSRLPKKADFLRQVAALSEPAIYAPYYQSRNAALDTLAVPGELTIERREVEIEGRLAIGLGSANVVENGVALHRTYGVPYLPGSGLKGMAAMFARTRLRDPQTNTLDPHWANGDYYYVVFGATDDSGFVTFHDALPVPGQKSLLVADVLTPHHRDYYGGKLKPPADWDSPVPIPFLSVRGKFEVVLSGPPQWTQIALDVLLAAWRREGAGAKTSSGYGRIKDESPRELNA